jgi:Glycosyl Hydrolase Family 88
MNSICLVRAIAQNNFRKPAISGSLAPLGGRESGRGVRPVDSKMAFGKQSNERGKSVRQDASASQRRTGRRSRWVVCIILLIMCGLGQLRAAESASVVLTAMERVADWQLANPSKHPATDWTVGAGDAGFMALAGISGNVKYRDAMRAAGGAIQWKVGPGEFHADDYCVGQTYAELYLLYHDPQMLTPLREHLDKIMAAQTQAVDLSDERWRS